jgi:hypothetical protein
MVKPLKISLAGTIFEDIEHCHKYLDERGLLRYDQVINRSVFDEMITVPWDPVRPMSYTGPHIALCTAIRKAGFFITSRGMDQFCIRLMTPGEVPREAEKRKLKRYRELLLDQEVMQAQDISLLDARQQAAFDRQMDVLAREAARIRS